ncbi:MAG: tetratricopeptide repeat protein [Solirubrobacteraceae bacterium]|jgi:hypothetical protein
MLFDLRGRGRRRTVQGIYVTLAVLMGGGLVLFGIGGSVSGGLFDAIGLTNHEGGQAGGNDALTRLERQAERRVRNNPRDAAGWAMLTRTRFELAGQGENYDQRTSTFSPKGRRQLTRASQAWERYLALDPPHDDVNVARLMVQAYSPTGLNRPAGGVRAAEIVADAQPSPQTYFQLALYAYAAGQTRKGDLAGRRAVELAPRDQRPGVQTQVRAAKRQHGFGAPPGGGAPPPPASG